MISGSQKLLVFLWIIGHGGSQRQAAIIFQHSRSVISRIFHDLLGGFLLLYTFNVRLPDPENPGPSRLPGYRERFKDCLGAVDGTLLRGKIPKKKKTPTGGPGYAGKNMRLKRF